MSVPLRQRLVAGVLARSGRLAVALPDAILTRLAELVGAGHYVLAGRRRALVRRNLRRVCRHLVAHGLASPEVAAAARDRRALERLVRGVFRHHARYYLEVVQTRRYTPDFLVERLELDDPGLVAEAFAGITPSRGAIFLGLHFGAMELPAVYATRLMRCTVVAPMETIGNASLQDYLLAQRKEVGVRFVDPRGSRHELQRTLESGGVLALVGDRDIGGTGRAVELFGAPARLSAGPALLALETGAPVWVTAVRRLTDGDYAARVLRLDPAEAGALEAGLPLRERVARLMKAQARTYETLVADAPEQWWTLLFPIWEERGSRPAS